MKSGIYFILNTITNKFYIGSAINLTERWRIHKCLLDNNKHFNCYLQSVWNKYWSVSFQFHVIEYCDKNKLIEREQYWIDITQCYNRKIGYNLRPTANSQLGLKMSNKLKEKLKQINLGKHRSEETKAKISKTMKIIKNTQESKLNSSMKMLGNKNSQSTRNFKIWPHEKGSTCKCSECRAKKVEFTRQWRIKQNDMSFVQ